MQDVKDVNLLINNWVKSVSGLCRQNNINPANRNDITSYKIPDVGIINIGYETYRAYDNVVWCIKRWTGCPGSFVYRKQLIDAVARWYSITAQGTGAKVMYRVLPNAVFARYISKVK